MIRGKRLPVLCLVAVFAAATAMIERTDGPSDRERGASDTRWSDEAAPGDGGDGLAFYRRHWQARDVSLGPVAACFAPGTSDEVVRFVGEWLGQIPLGERYQLTGRWSGAAGTPRNITWSFVPDGLSISSGVGEPVEGSSLFATLDAAFAAQPNPRAFWISRFESVFARWSQLAGLTYTRVTFGGNDWDDGAAWGTGGTAGLRGDVRISMKVIDGGGNILAYNFFPSNGDMVLDKNENWSQGGTGNRFMRNIISHEHGHGMGLLHVCPITSGKLMEPFLSTGFDGPRHDDIRAAQRHYGDPYGVIGSPATAFDVGLVEVNAPVNIGAVPTPAVPNSGIASIDLDGEQDYFKFTVAGRRFLRVTLAPQGITYDSSPQNCSGQTGSCCSGNNVNSLAAADLNMQVIRGDGVTVLATAAAQPAGSAEVLSDVLLPTGGTYYVRVYEGNAPTESQLYTATLSVRTNISTDPGDTGDGPLEP